MVKLQTWWMSFCDTDKPKGSQFLGCIIIDGKDFKDAHFNTHLLQINPGGEVEGYDVTKAAKKIKPEYKNRLLTKKECDEAIED